MNKLPEGVVEAITQEPDEYVIDGWSAYHKVEGESFLDIFSGTSWDYEGYLVLTSNRVIFVKREGVLHSTFAVVPFLVERLENVKDVKVSNRELVLSGERFKISGATLESVVDMVKEAVSSRYQGAEPLSDSETSE
jgi:hypothetical protein